MGHTWLSQSPGSVKSSEYTSGLQEANDSTGQARCVSVGHSSLSNTWTIPQSLQPGTESIKVYTLQTLASPVLQRIMRVDFWPLRLAPCWSPLVPTVTGVCKIPRGFSRAIRSWQRHMPARILFPHSALLRLMLGILEFGCVKWLGSSDLLTSRALCLLESRISEW